MSCKRVQQRLQYWDKQCKASIYGQEEHTNFGMPMDTKCFASQIADVIISKWGLLLLNGKTYMKLLATTFTCIQHRKMMSSFQNGGYCYFASMLFCSTNT